jgi:hypothetical protein
MSAIVETTIVIIEMAALPTGRGFAPTDFPQHPASEQLQSTDSTGSQDSLLTQLPMPKQMLAQAYPKEPVCAYTRSASQSFGGGFDRVGELLEV